MYYLPTYLPYAFLSVKGVELPLGCLIPDPVERSVVNLINGLRLKISLYYDYRVIIYNRRRFIRLTTILCLTGESP